LKTTPNTKRVLHLPCAILMSGNEHVLCAAAVLLKDELDPSLENIILHKI